MGTRHKVRVIQDKKIIINQYGQWDGYPTEAGKVIVNFLKNQDNVEFLRNIKEKFIYKDKIEQDRFIFGEMTMNPEETFKEIYDFIYDSDQLFENEETGKKVRWCNISQRQLIDEVYKKFGFEMTAYYMMITRDTGYKVFDTMKELNRLEPDKNVPIFESDYEGWDIEARYTVNLDKNKLEIEWHNRTLEFDLGNLPNYEELEDFEKETRKIEDEKWSKQNEEEEAI